MYPLPLRKKDTNNNKRLDGTDFKYLSGFGFIGGRVGASMARSSGKRKKRDSIVGIGQWGRKKRSLDNKFFKKRSDI